MDDSIVFNAMVNTLVNSMSAVIVSVDATEQITHVHISKHTDKKVRYIVGKKFFRILKLIFDFDNATMIFNTYFSCLNTCESNQISKLDHISIRGLTEYMSCNFMSIPEKNCVIVHIQNITESVLMKEEFSSMSEQYESVNRELCAAVSNLDFHLMDIEQAQKKIAALYRITSIVQKTVNEKEILDEILDGLVRELGLTHVSILLLDEEKQELSVKANRGQDMDFCIPLGEGIIGYAAKNRELVYVENVRNDPRYIPIGKVDSVSEVAIPLVVDDKVFGVLNIETTDGRTLQPYDIDLLRSLASQVAMTIAHASHVARVEKQAITDGLTGLYNYRYFRSVLEQEFKRALRYQRPLSMLMIDIDYFKNYNDTNGHLAGDEVLHTIASLLKNTCRDVDIVVRYGGEEFAILLPETDVKEAQCIAERLRQTVYQYPFYNGHLQPNGKVSVSIGISGYPHDAHSYVELINFADIALYAAKNSSRNCIRIHEYELQ